MKITKILAIGFAATVALSSTSAMAEADGEKLFKKKCGSCHSMKAGEHKMGPSLAGVVGRAAGSVADFDKYKAMKGASFTWDEVMLGEWITDQTKFLKAQAENVGDWKTTMSAKIMKEDERAAIIEYLKR